ncbi:Piezo-type mechanosensitive ion channel component 2 [Thelohanellus kitauei]|uniref:Piezo-type mechanosensitive ion channel component 2 n=1 Tax=Thelohanellus kitauei TaxID=669202 RepID=A0A0C2J2W3_THEKT|nr:Piezo-type mechanosensitive ion channel component 2 [Thelohanellus kitauei]
MKIYQEEIFLTNNTKGCSSTSDMFLFEQLGFAWFACDSMKDIVLKLAADLLIASWSVILIIYNFTLPPTTSQTRAIVDSYEISFRLKITVVICDLIGCIMAVFIALFNPNVTSMIYFYAIVFYPLFKLLASREGTHYHRLITYKVMSKFDVYVFYFATVVYLIVVYLHRFSIIRELLRLDNNVSKILRITIFSHLDEISTNSTSYILFILHVGMILVLSIKIYFGHYRDGELFKSKMSFVTNSTFYHIKYFINQYAHVLTTVCAFTWTFNYKSYLSFVIFFIAMIPFLLPCGYIFYFIQSLVLEIVFFCCLVLQYVSTLSFSEDFYIRDNNKLLFDIGLYSSGYAPLVLSVKYFTFLVTLIALSSFVKRKFNRTREADRAACYVVACDTCDKIRDETWLIQPNIVVQFFTYLLTVFSRTIICIYPLIELYYNRSNVHSCILIAMFLLLSVTQTKKNGWEALQEFCLHIVNYYLSVWFLLYYFVQIFNSVLSIDKIHPFDIILELFDFNNESRHFVITSLGWLLISLMLHKFLLSYYNSVLISTQVVVASEDRNFAWPQSFDLLSMINFSLYMLYQYFLKLNKIMVINRRLIISIICFAVSLVRPSLLTFLTFFFSCLYAISYHKRINAVIASILMTLSVIIVLIMVIYQNPRIPVVIFSPFLSNCTSNTNESTISTGLSKTDSFSPILAFLCVVFIFSFLNSLSRYYDSQNAPRIVVSIENLKSFALHFLRYFITYFGYELIILTGVLAVIQHKDSGSVISIILIIFIMLSCPNFYGYHDQNSKYFINLLTIYKFMVFFLMVTRFSLHVCSMFLECWISSQVTDDSKLNFLIQLFITRTVSTENKIQVIFDFIHLFIVRIYIRSLMKNKLKKVNQLLPDTDFTACGTFLQLFHHSLNSHFIQIVLFVIYLASFDRIHACNISFMVCFACIIVFEQRMFFSKKFKVLLRVLNFLPIILILTKLTTQLLFCLNPPLFSSDRIFLKFLLDIKCPDSDVINIYNSYMDMMALLVLLIQNRIYITKSFNYTIINYYLYHLEAVNISNIVTHETEAYRTDYENRIRAKHDKIKSSIEAIKKNIEVDCGIPTRKTKMESLYGVDQIVFDKFYSHRDGQNQIFDDYNHRDADDYILDLNQHSVSHPEPSTIAQEEQAPQPLALSQKILSYLSFLSIFKKLFDMMMAHFKKINKKDHSRRKKILAVIEDGKRVHYEEIKRLIHSISPDFEYRYDKEISSADIDLPSVESPNKFVSFLITLFQIFRHMLIRNTNFIVFIAMVINQIYSASILSLIVILSYFLYAAVVVPRPPATYWRALSLFVLFSAFARYVASIFPLSTFATCSFSSCSAESRRTVENVFCIVRFLGIDGCEYLPYTDLFLLFTIQLHIISLHYRGVLHFFNLDRDESTSHASTFVWTMMKEKFRKFMKNYERSICTLEPDNYIVIFITQLGQWIIIAFCWNSFIGPTTVSGDITKIIKGSIIPVSFSILITFQSLFILFDRFINLNRMRSTKFIYTITLVILIHIFVFFIVPRKTQTSVIRSPSVCLFYILYCIYFYYSYIPIRNGYNVTNVLPYTITKYHNYYSIGIIFFIIYFPFIYELDTVLRWYSSTTALGFFQYIKIDEIFFNMHICKSFRKISQERNEPSGTPFYGPLKLFITLVCLFIFFVALLLPLWLYSTGITAIKSVLPSQIDFSVSINGYSDLYFSSVVQSNFKVFKKFDDISEIYNKLPPTKQYYAKSVLFDYQEIGDIIYVEFSKPSYNTWTISHPTRSLLVNDIKKTLNETVFRLRYKLHWESSKLINVFGREKTEGSFVIPFNQIQNDSLSFQKSLVATIRFAQPNILLNKFVPTAIRVEASKPLSIFKKVTNSEYSPVCAYHEYEQTNLTFPSVNEWWSFTTVDLKNGTTDPKICDDKPHTSESQKIGIYFFIDFLKSSYIDLFSPSKK